MPAAGFYEWNRQKEKAVFSRPDGDPLLMAGLCQPDPGGEGERFVILTTDANSSVLPVHPRMPLILVENLLAFRPQPLERFQEYEQQTLNF